MSTTFPGTEVLPVVTSGAHAVNVEAVLALRPTLIITDGTIGPRDVLEQLRHAGITVVFVTNEASFTGASQLARDVAVILGVESSGELLAHRIDRDVAEARAAIAAILPENNALIPRVLFLYLRGATGVYYLFGEGSGADELIAGLGAIDVAAEMRWVGERPMTDEAVIVADPDVILVMTAGLESAGGIDALLAAKPALALTHAGRNRRFVDMADGDILSFGPRSAAVLDALARAIYTRPE
jgi:iron complex transport system substrate-binding protein